MAASAGCGLIARPAQAASPGSPAGAPAGTRSLEGIAATAARMALGRRPRLPVPARIGPGIRQPVPAPQRPGHSPAPVQ